MFAACRYAGQDAKPAAGVHAGLREDRFHHDWWAKQSGAGSPAQAEGLPHFYFSNVMVDSPEYLW
jgi:hypothetical protein